MSASSDVHVGTRDTGTSGKAGKMSSIELIKELLLYYPSHIWLDLNESFLTPYVLFL